jgi:hypothetical protein
MVAASIPCTYLIPALYLAAGALGLHIGVTAPLRTGLGGKAIESDLPPSRSCYHHIVYTPALLLCAHQFTDRNRLSMNKPRQSRLLE